MRADGEWSVFANTQKIISNNWLIRAYGNGMSWIWRNLHPFPLYFILFFSPYTRFKLCDWATDNGSGREGNEGRKSECFCWSSRRLETRWFASLFTQTTRCVPSRIYSLLIWPLLTFSSFYFVCRPRWCGTLRKHGFWVKWCAKSSSTFR